MKQTAAHRLEEAGLRRLSIFRCALCLLLVSLLPGCAALGKLPWNDPSVIGPKTPCRLPQNPTVAEVIDHVNANVEKVHGWRSDGVKIRASSVPITLYGSMVVEREKRLHLEVKSPMGKEADFGSNDEVFWIWSKQNRGPNNEPAPLIYAAHADMDIARQKLPMPFEPAWLMEALGVAPLSAENVQMEGQPGINVIKLVSQHQMPDGRAIRKVVSVHGCHGYVMDHTVFDVHGKPLVRVAMTDQRIDARTGAVLPRHIKLDWPQEQTSLALEFPTLEVNPLSVPDAVWELPHMPNTTHVNLGGGPHRRTTGPLASNAARSRAELVEPERIAPAGDESFELPQLGRPRGPVELEAIEFEPPMTEEPSGRSKLPAWQDQ